MRPILLLLLAPFLLGWTVTHERDRMTDKSLTWATATSGDARLVVGCLNGEPQPRVMWDGGKRIGWGNVAVSYRYDDGPVFSHMAMVSQDGGTLYPWISTAHEALSKMEKARRVRVTLGRAFYDFDVAAGERLPAIRCGKAG